jgi:1-acyl-sn-glycerol-3-phosphate acyltransferase
VVLSKHQSAWETIALQQIFPPLCYVLKRELLRVPFFGWALACIPGIAIDRAAGKDALTQVVEQGRERLKEGLWVVVFPEGTRVAPGRRGATSRAGPSSPSAPACRWCRWRTTRASSGAATPSSSARARSSSASAR